MKIALFSYWHLHYSASLANELSKTDKVFVFVNKKSEEFKSSNDISKLFNSSVKVITNIYPNSIFKKILWIIQILTEIKRNKFDIWHMHESRSILPLWPIKLFFPSLPIVWTLHDVRPHLGEEKYYKNELILKINRFIVNKIIVHGEYIKNKLLSEYKFIKKRKVHIIPHGALNNYKGIGGKCSININSDYILFFGRMYKYKGLNVIIKAQPIVNNFFPNLKFVIAGRGDELNKFKHKIKDNSNFIIYDYYLSDAEVHYLFEYSQFLILPYLEASQSGVIALAFSYGKTVITSNVGSIPEVVINNKNGLVISKNNHIELANAIIKLYSDKNLLKRLSLEAYKTATEKLNWHLISKMTRSIYLSIIREK